MESPAAFVIALVIGFIFWVSYIVASRAEAEAERENIEEENQKLKSIIEVKDAIAKIKQETEDDISDINLGNIFSQLHSSENPDTPPSTRPEL